MMASCICHGHILSLVAQPARFMMMRQAGSATWIVWPRCHDTGRKTLSESQTNGEQMLLPFVIPLRHLKRCQIQKHNINRWHNPTLSRNYSQNLNRIRIFIVIMKNSCCWYCMWWLKRRKGITSIDWPIMCHSFWLLTALPSFRVWPAVVVLASWDE